MERKENFAAKKVELLKAKIDEMLLAKSIDELVDIYTDVVGEMGAYYAAMTSKILKEENKISETKEKEPETDSCESENLSETKDNIVEIKESETGTEVSFENESEAVEVEKEEPEETEQVEQEKAESTAEQVAQQPEKVDDDSPVYAVFYSLNNAAYIAINERMHACVPVRNLAKAYCVPADLTSVAQGQNELSKYKLDKLKPIQIKFLTQKEYDDSIGKAKAMQELMANMPTTPTNNTISSEHKVANFAANNKTTSSGHIGEKSKGNAYDSAYGANNKKGGYDFFHSDSYSLYKDKNGHGSSNAQSQKIYKVSMTDMLENPRELYKAMHNGIDDIDMSGLPCSYENDIIDIAPAMYAEIDDFEILIPAINKTINAIANTKAGWLVDPFVASYGEVDNDYMMDIDYALLDLAIQDWNETNNPCQIMYVEDFDPTVITFKKNIEAVSKKCMIDKEELAAKAIYNYVRCLMAYQRFKWKRGIM